MKHLECLAAAGVLLAATTTQQPPVFPVRTDLVRLDVLASAGGRPLLGLTAKDFEVFDNGQAQRLDGVYARTMPLDVWLVLDTSESVAGSTLSELVRAAGALAGELEPPDRASLLAASDDLRLLVPPTHDRQLVRQTLAGLAAAGNTRLLDGLYASLLLSEDQARRSMIVACTDGRDNVSWSSEDDVLEAAGAVNAVVYTVGLRSKPTARFALRPSWRTLGRQPDETFLRRLAVDTGGRFLPIRSPQRLEAAFIRALTEMKTSYVLAYSRQGRAARDGWHTVEVKLAGRKGEVRTRRRYFVPEGDVDLPPSSEGSEAPPALWPQPR